MKPLWKLLRYLKPYRWMVLAGMLATAGAVAADLAIPRLTQRAIEASKQVGIGLQRLTNRYNAAPP